LNLPQLRDNLVGLVSLVCHCGPPSWSKPYFKVDPFNGGGSGATKQAPDILSFTSIFSAKNGVYGYGVAP
ncbi:hypothetical protein, partial [Chelativorans composti]